MSTPAKVMDLELTRPLASIDGLADYRGVHALLRVHGTPVGQIWLPVEEGACSVAVSAEALWPCGPWIARELVHRALAAPIPEEGVDLPALLAAGRGGDAVGNALGARADGARVTAQAAGPLVTAAVCTRDRPDDLARCLDGLLDVDYPCTEVLVVDNAPRTDGTERLVRSRRGPVRYVREPRPGLNWARSRAVAEASGEIVAFTDDDVVVDPGWIGAFVRLFEGTPEVMAATGLVAPYELETDAQLIFEQFGSFGQGFARLWGKVDREAGERAARRHGGSGEFGTGANMAFRRRLFREVGPFDPALDVGTATNGGGDLEFFFRVIKEGHTLVREPRAVVRHRHRDDYDGLRRQLRTWGLGIGAHVLRSCEAYREEWPGFLWMTYRWIGLRFVRRFAQNLWQRRFPQELLIDELRDLFRAPARYREARRAAEAIEAEMGPVPLPARRVPARMGGVGGAHDASAVRATGARAGAAPVAARVPRARPAADGRREERLSRAVDLEAGVPAAIDAAHARRLEVDVRWRGEILARATLEPAGRPVRSAELRDAIADALAPRATLLFRDLDRVGPGVRIPELLRRS